MKISFGISLHARAVGGREEICGGDSMSVFYTPLNEPSSKNL